MGTAKGTYLQKERVTKLSEINDEIKRIRYETKSKESIPREVRIAQIAELLESSDEMPDDTALKAMADLILYEELSDNHPDKMSLEEYPIMSDYQLARRQSGLHRKKPKAGDLPVRMEVPLSWAENYGNDGKNYSYPTKRKRDDYENEWVNDKAASRNRERREKYDAFVKGELVPGEDGKLHRVFSEGIFTVNIKTGEKTIHTKEESNDATS